MNRANDRSRDYAASLGLSLAVLAGELPVPATDGTSDPWVKVTPRGPVTTRDGRPYSFDPEKLVGRFKEDGVDLPADFDHGIALNSIKGVKTPAVGWATDLQARDDGTYAKMDWLPDAKAAMADRTHRYISPTFKHDDDGNATWLHSISLTAAPALSMPALASALMHGSEAGGSLATLTAAVGLPGSTDLGAVLEAAARTIVGSVPKAAHDATLALLSSTADKLSALTNTTRKTDVERLVGDAIREKKIVPAQREGYLALCATEAGAETFRGLMAATMPMLQPSGLDGKLAPGGDRPATAQAIIEAATVYRADKAKLGLLVSMPDAINAVARPPAA